MNIPKPKLKLADRGSMLILAFTFVVVAPVYYASIRPQVKDSAIAQRTDINNEEPKADQPAAVEELPEVPTVTPTKPTDPAVAPNKDKSTPKTSQNHSIESKPKPKNCSRTNKEAGERYLQQLQQIRKDKQNTYSAIVKTSGLFSLKSKNKLSSLNQDTYMKELNAYKAYLGGVRAAGCAPSGYKAP